MWNNNTNGYLSWCLIWFDSANLYTCLSRGLAECGCPTHKFFSSEAFLPLPVPISKGSLAILFEFPTSHGPETEIPSFQILQSRACWGYTGQSLKETFQLSRSGEQDNYSVTQWAAPFLSNHRACLRACLPGKKTYLSLSPLHLW